MGLEANNKHVNRREARVGQRANGIIMMKGNTSKFGNGISEIELGTKQEVKGDWNIGNARKCSKMEMWP